MQQIKKKLYEKCLTGFAGTAWIAGLLIAGSDSTYMPWLNGVGLLLFLGASILMGKQINPFGSKSDSAKILRFPKKSDTGTCVSNQISNGISTRASKKKNHRINTRYALGT